jgi:ABC-type bacteriocin/lantibiotic exporter with double-glycine peptidase domain
MSIQYIYQFLLSELFSITLETLVLLLLLYFIFKVKKPLHDVLFAGIFATGMTIPYVWFVFPFMRDWSNETSLLCSEPVITIIEALFYNKFLKLNAKTSFIVSCICNISSFFLKNFLYSHGFWIY